MSQDVRAEHARNGGHKPQGAHAAPPPLPKRPQRSTVGGPNGESPSSTASTQGQAQLSPHGFGGPNVTLSSSSEPQLHVAPLSSPGADRHPMSPVSSPHATGGPPHGVDVSEYWRQKYVDMEKRFMEQKVFSAKLGRRLSVSMMLAGGAPALPESAMAGGDADDDYSVRMPGSFPLMQNIHQMQMQTGGIPSGIGITGTSAPTRMRSASALPTPTFSSNPAPRGGLIPSPPLVPMQQPSSPRVMSYLNAINNMQLQAHGHSHSQSLAQNQLQQLHQQAHGPNSSPIARMDRRRSIGRITDAALRRGSSTAQHAALAALAAGAFTAPSPLGDDTEAGPGSGVPLRRLVSPEDRETEESLSRGGGASTPGSTASGSVAPARPARALPEDASAETAESGDSGLDKDRPEFIYRSVGRDYPGLSPSNAASDIALIIDIDSGHGSPSSAALRAQAAAKAAVAAVSTDTPSVGAPGVEITLSPSVAASAAASASTPPSASASVAGSVSAPSAAVSPTPTAPAQSLAPPPIPARMKRPTAPSISANESEAPAQTIPSVGPLGAAGESSDGDADGAVPVPPGPDEDASDMAAADRDFSSLPFAEDSPFFRAALAKQVTTVNALGDRLRSLTEYTSSFSGALHAFSRASRDLGMALGESWAAADVAAVALDPFGLAAKQGGLGIPGSTPTVGAGGAGAGTSAGGGSGTTGPTSGMELFRSSIRGLAGLPQTLAGLPQTLAGGPQTEEDGRTAPREPSAGALGLANGVGGGPAAAAADGAGGQTAQGEGPVAYDSEAYHAFRLEVSQAMGGLDAPMQALSQLFMSIDSFLGRLGASVRFAREHYSLLLPVCS